MSQFHNTPLLKALTEYQQLNRRRFHVPGHAGLDLLDAAPILPSAIYRYDQTEVEGLDVLSEPSECLKEAQAKAAETFGAAQSFYLVNGSSAGLMAAMLATLQPGDQVLLPRNVHRSVINGLILTGAEPIWFLPEWLPDWGLWGAVSVAHVAQLLEQYPQVKLVMLTSPTYEGVGSDIQSLAQFCRKKGVLLIVDEAHGSLWPFNEQLPPSALSFSCDGVVHSLHKTAGSLTQSALFHLPIGSRIDVAQFQQALNLVQSTSPSYLLMASLDAAQAFLASSQGQERIQFLLEQVSTLRHALKANLPGMFLFEPVQDSLFWDPTKLYLQSHYEPGTDWAVRIEADQQLAYEAASPYGALYLAGLGLEKDDYDFFFNVLQQLGQSYQNQSLTPYHCQFDPLPLPVRVLSPREAFFARGLSIEVSQSIGRIAKETIVHCPPGIPVLLPGEQIQAAHQPYLPEQFTVVR